MKSEPKLPILTSLAVLVLLFGIPYCLSSPQNDGFLGMLWLIQAIPVTIGIAFLISLLGCLRAEWKSRLVAGILAVPTIPCVLVFCALVAGL